MGKGAARRLTVRRSRLRAYLLLARFSNLPTIWTNVLAGTIVSGAAFVRADVGRLCLAMSALYTAGMFLNDACSRRRCVRDYCLCRGVDVDRKTSGKKCGLVDPHPDCGHFPRRCRGDWRERRWMAGLDRARRVSRDVIDATGCSGDVVARGSV